MHEIVIIYASEDLALVGRLAALLKKYWEDVWFAEDGISSGDWRRIVAPAINSAMCVVALSSRNSVTKDIFIDEMGEAKGSNRPLLPFLIEDVKMPLGFGTLSRTEAYGWKGEKEHPQFQKLLKKIAKEMEGQTLKRKATLQINGKEFQVPGFVFSLSSYETQISPKNGLELFSMLKQPKAALLSSYDACSSKADRVFNKRARELKESECLFFMDSGNYESYRKDDLKSHSKKKPNPDGWCSEKYIEMVNVHAPDVVFSFDKINPQGTLEEVATRIVRGAQSDRKKITSLTTEICPIVHLPNKPKEEMPIEDYAAELVTKVAEALNPVMISIPERELGNGMSERIRTVGKIRSKLNQLGKYYPLHLLGTGNPMTILLLANAGADCFDGLEWCRTVADWEKRTLHHFQQLDFFLNSFIGRLSNELVRLLLESDDVPYEMKVACYNMEVMNAFTDELQSMLNAGNIKYMMNSMIPHVGATMSERVEK